MARIVIGAVAKVSKDGRRFGRIVIATDSTDPDFRGLNALELDADPDVVATMSVFPGFYDLQLDLRALNGFREKNIAKQYVTAARLVAPLAPVKEKAQ
jgi:hypothetical protein